ncbi:aminoglycoside phosphotransferase [Solemya pervernicosa gill symbiont]|uniref:Aminoglycoside phosphotransferase n=2 Tax=Gammaproteobacteria incertae sedis TaxID=118884 RepID=A0A1T2L4B2_9GAMM|nr:phosphotransferase [Candidatus Reidiella endopervernicosa]OOZ39955.1 aminoglycoside phosphotransferase [Solemya pervernicosa gill symbiont]QKQ25943.1 phosphotransferase [Candidatus Reidiella endopervernicosa]
MGERLAQLQSWLTKEAGLPEFEIEPASGDASFRRYFRLSFEGETRIAMDAPPERENSRPFIEVGEQLFELGLNVPEILHHDLEQGFMLLGDLGNRQYLDELNEQTVDRYYGDALGALLTIQACGPDGESLPHYDRELLLAEMNLFRDWYLTRHLEHQLSESEQAVLDQSFELLAESALEQPQVTVHRDYHSRNLMVTEVHNPGILDFQDAVYGPVTYDLVSLLRDCYIEWPRERVEGWVRGYHDLALDSGILREPCESRFMRWFDLMGVQRHLKAAGIFARLNHRDGRPGYLKDIPRTVGYIYEVSGRDSELAPLHTLLESLVMEQLTK